MILSASYDELSRLFREKSGQSLGLRYKDADTLTFIYDATITLPILNKPVTHTINVDMRVVEFAPPRAVLQFDAGPAGNMALDMASRKLLDKLPEGLVESFQSGRAVLCLDAVPQLKTLFEHLTVNDISFYDQSLRIDASL